MATKKAKKQTIVNMAATPEDIKIIEFLKGKLGMNTTGAIRYSLRRTFEQEKPAPQSA